MKNKKLGSKKGRKDGILIGTLKNNSCKTTLEYFFNLAIYLMFIIFIMLFTTVTTGLYPKSNLETFQISFYLILLGLSVLFARWLPFISLEFKITDKKGKVLMVMK